MNTYGLEAYLDKGRGECHLRQPEIAKLVEDAVRSFHGERYDLRALVVMPNHVHALFKVDATPIAEIIESWKKHTANKVNRLLNRRGEFWQADYWDIFMRDSGHELETRNYIENNPAKAGLRKVLWLAIMQANQVAKVISISPHPVWQ